MNRASNLTIARRLIPYALLRYILIPLCTFLILIGWNRYQAQAFWDANT